MRSSRPWARTSPKDVTTGVVYFTVTSPDADTLTGASVDPTVAGMAQLHETVMDNGSMSMHEVESVPLEAGKSVTFAPGGYHLMFIGIAAPFEQGKRVKGTLVFEKAGKVEVEYAVEAIGAMGVSIIGANCGRGTDEMRVIAAEMAEARPAGVFLMTQSNAGLPKLVGDEFVYDGTPEVMADWARDMRELGIDSYRFSIAWPRILPDGTGAINPKGLAWYERFVDALLEADRVRREALQVLETARSKKNQLAAQIPKAPKDEKAAKLAEKGVEVGQQGDVLAHQAPQHLLDVRHRRVQVQHLRPHLLPAHERQQLLRQPRPALRLCEIPLARSATPPTF